MSSNFKNLGITEPILKAIEEMGFEMPTEVQSEAIPQILDNKDLIVMSKTGSGKTAVFGISMLQTIDPKVKGLQGLILTPTRELAVQVDNELKLMGKYLEHRTTAVYGQHSKNVEIQAFKKGVSIITGTPGRVFDHISQGSIDVKQIRFLVLDEADRMLDMGFIDQVRRIIKVLPKNRVTLLFSATMPAEISRICWEHMKQPLTIEIESETMTVDTIKQVYYRVEQKDKFNHVNQLLLYERPKSCMIFCNTRISVDRVQNYLFKKGYVSQALHGEIPQAKRIQTINRFKKGEILILVATDVAARGIHIDNLSLVINYDVPVEKDSYVHRIGRTGRAGNGGLAMTLVTGDDIMSLYEIEEHIGTMIKEEPLPKEAELDILKTEIEQWLAEQAQKRKQAGLYQESKPKIVLKRNSNEKNSSHIKLQNNSSKPERQVVERNKEELKVTDKVNNISKKRNKTNFSQNNKPTRVINRTIVPRTKPKEDIITKVSGKVEVQQQKDDSIKKPFYKRILNKLFGNRTKIS